MKILRVPSSLFIYQTSDWSKILQEYDKFIWHDAQWKTKRSIIGILTQEAYPGKATQKYVFQSYIPASYVKDVEKSGGRVVPIYINQTRSYYEKIVKQLNGIYFPGGNVTFETKNGHADAAAIIYEIVVDQNNAGVYYPMFGTCQGIELITYLSAGRHHATVPCNSHQNIPIILKNDNGNKLYSTADSNTLQILTTKNSTVHAHDECVTKKKLRKHHLLKHWLISSYAVDTNGLKFVASIEHNRYPFYAVQFHPEKSAFEMVKRAPYTRNLDAIHANRHFLDFFISECRKNGNKFKSEAEELNQLINSKKSVFTAMYDDMFYETYFFQPI